MCECNAVGYIFTIISYNKKKQQKQLTNHIKYDPNMTKIHRNNIVKWFLRFQVRVWCIVSAVRFRD